VDPPEYGARKQYQAGIGDDVEGSNRFVQCILNHHLVRTNLFDIQKKAYLINAIPCKVPWMGQRTPKRQRHNRGDCPDNNHRNQASTSDKSDPLGHQTLHEQSKRCFAACYRRDEEDLGGIFVLDVVLDVVAETMVRRTGMMQYLFIQIEIAGRYNSFLFSQAMIDC
jgi:hypothetical protein